MPDHDTLLSWIQHTAPSTLIRQSSWAVMALESVHLIGLALLGGAAVVAALAALRADGLGGLSVPTLVTGLAPLRRAGLFLMVISGALITISMPFKYYANTAFRWKMLLLGVALLTSWALRRVSNSRVSVAAMPVIRAAAVRPSASHTPGTDPAAIHLAASDTPFTPTPPGDRLRAPRALALAVLLLWIGVGCCGRLIGFL